MHYQKYLTYSFKQYISKMNEPEDQGLSSITLDTPGEQLNILCKEYGFPPVLQKVCSLGLGKNYKRQIVDLLLQGEKPPRVLQTLKLGRTKDYSQLDKFMKRKNIAKMLVFLQDVNYAQKHPGIGGQQHKEGQHDNSSEEDYHYNSSEVQQGLMKTAQKPLKPPQEIFLGYSPIFINKDAANNYQPIFEIPKFEDTKVEAKQLQKDIIQLEGLDGYQKIKNLINSPSSRIIVELCINFFKIKAEGVGNYKFKQNENRLYQTLLQQSLKSNPLSATVTLEYLVSLSERKTALKEKKEQYLMLLNKKQEQIDWQDPIVVLQLFVLLYSGNQIYQNLNYKLRAKSVLYLPFLIAILKKGLKALSQKYPTGQKGIIFKQITKLTLHRVDGTYERLEEPKLGHKYTFWGFISTSKEKDSCPKSLYLSKKFQRWSNIKLNDDNEDFISFEWEGIEKLVQFAEKEVLLFPFSYIVNNFQRAGQNLEYLSIKEHKS